MITDTETSNERAARHNAKAVQKARARAAHRERRMAETPKPDKHHSRRPTPSTHRAARMAARSAMGHAKRKRKDARRQVAIARRDWAGSLTAWSKATPEKGYPRGKHGRENYYRHLRGGEPIPYPGPNSPDPMLDVIERLRGNLLHQALTGVRP